MSGKSSEVQSYTMTESRILAILNDGKDHPRDELLLAVDSDGLCSKETLNQHISNLRKKLPEGHYIICGKHGYSTYFQRVILYVPEKDGDLASR